MLVHEWVNSAIIIVNSAPSLLQLGHPVPVELRPLLQQLFQSVDLQRPVEYPVSLHVVLEPEAVLLLDAEQLAALVFEEIVAA